MECGGSGVNKMGGEGGDVKGREEMGYGGDGIWRRREREGGDGKVGVEAPFHGS